MRVRTESKREAILEAASQVFLESGFEGASMAEIAARVGGSKATLYGYFGSKEDLFVEVMHSAAKHHFERIFAALENDSDDLPLALQRFGERTLAVLCQESAVQARRAIIAESGRSDIGVRFFEGGPKKGTAELGRFLALQMEKGKLRQSDPIVAAHHLMALLDSETITPRLFGIEKKLTKGYVREAVGRALETFLAGHRPSGGAGNKGS
ncbi:TetR/AcrR family transcriptional regulator [Variovorax arabinosiphilus]|uniref:TetR/AcrR family transcriptional regulator n=1 Tax=Variovorax arabinosiphilus TaxID=3053498 RepID=UPI0025786445|nr:MULTISPECIES: TetR/AcrR family transcriptional regulator [unclassified Variovorax]MDM0120783.1 TetR/AcrR family transcriptional regulator [Variovorax sp. J2L1-78]MDM0127305.1 TetR/AcrR family transcriptional regulator [Variovorax sp. J2L1-63]MDM0236163.1 TetR/AcrR family transcriptional regulator [Variovorax sp. J2R1-6]